MNAKILVVDDEPRYIHLIRVNLEAADYEVLSAPNGEAGLELAYHQNLDLIIMDVNMPSMDGFTACERIRQFSSVPIIMLTGRSEEQDRVHGLNMGADDYLVKPFSALELIARVRAVLRRSQVSKALAPERFFVHGDLKIDFARAEIWKQEKPVFLSATEYRLLIQFAQNAGKIISAEELLSSVWGPGYSEDKEILWVSIARLRHKLEENPRSPKHIVTRSGIGYLMPIE